jgi:hypothetical protein
MSNSIKMKMGILLIVELGKGSMATVYRGQYRDSNVAIKKINVGGLLVVATPKELKMYCLQTHPKIGRIVWVLHEELF